MRKLPFSPMTLANCITTTGNLR